LSRLISFKPSENRKLDQPAQNGTETSAVPSTPRRQQGAGQHHGDRAQRVHVIALGIGQAYHHIEAAVALEDLARLASPIAIETVSATSFHRQAVAADRVAVEANVEGGKAARLRHPHISRARHFCQNRSACCCAVAFKKREIVAIELDRTSLRTPPINSLNRISMGWVTSYLLPIMFCVLARMRSITWSLVVTPAGHSSLGLRMM
jgi:hypothetical protein